ncbi:MAG: hypothetical protein WB815_05915 [Nitrososphaeraceae archaeon]
MNQNQQMTPDQIAMFQEQQRQIQELIKMFNIADPNHPGNQQSTKKFWVKILLTDFQLNELRNLAQILGSQPYIDPQTRKPIVDPQTGKQVHALEDTTVAALMKSSALGTYLKIKLDEWQKQQQQAQQQMQPQPQAPPFQG